jgi:lysophospholipase L1-like esterase
MTDDAVPPGVAPAYRPGPVLRVAGLLLPGVRTVQRQVAPFAEDWDRANVAALLRTGPLWVALGDSMTQGIGAPDRSLSWVGQLGAWLAHAGHPYRVVNLSRTGARIRDVTGRQLGRLAELGLQPDLVTVLIGANDMLRRTKRETAPADFAMLLDQLPPAPTVTVVATLPPPREAAGAINALIEEAAAAGRIQLAEMRGRSLGAIRGTLAEDHFHPSEVGYSRIAKAFAAALTPTLQPPPPNSRRS